MRRMSLAIALLAIWGSGALLPMAACAGNGYGNGNGHGHGHGTHNAERHGVWRDSEGWQRAEKWEKGNALGREETFDWRDFRRQSRLLGIAGYKPLPPGIAKNLAKGKPLPPGIAKQALPASLARLLPRYPGREWNIVGNDLVSVITGTAMVAEIIRHAFD
ncbi:anti-virulence regulator CigR family protein [Edwardsiella tarda]|uniref:anti-virulence regulator CigR family protein n=1 Tax=Edwardsiella tarda TaxID=636 RepID=UPI003A86F74B